MNPRVSTHALRRLSLGVAHLLALGACEAPAAAPDAGNDAGPPRVCRSGLAWSPGRPAFVDRTAEWGLAGLNGNSLGVADLDGDGWPELVRMAGSPYDRIPGQVFFNIERGGRRVFEDRTEHARLFQVRGSPETGRSASFVRFGDVDNDGDADAFTGLFLYHTDATRTLLTDGAEVLLNDGTGAFALGPASVASPPNPLTSDGFFFDHDLDGRLDLALGYWYLQPAFRSFYGDNPQLFGGDGAGGFGDERTEAAGLYLPAGLAAIESSTNARPLFGFVACDVNDDGRTDIVGAAYGRLVNELFLAEGDRFTEVGAMSAVGSDDRRDFTDDESYRCYAGLPTRYTCPVRGWIPGQSDQPWQLGGNTFSFACGDFDNDLDLDLYESNIRHPDVGSASDPSEVLVNDGTGTFHRPGRESMGLEPPIDLTRFDEGGQHDAAFDFDADGWLDLYLAGSPYPHNRGWLFHHRTDAPLAFEWIGADAGFHHACALGTAMADFDHDGDLDLVVGTYGCNDPASVPPGESPDWSPPENQPVRFYENVSTDANWLAIRLVGRGPGGANRDGIGARVRVTTCTTPGDCMTQTRIVSTSSQNLSMEPVATFGLGASCDVERVEVRWPNEALTVESFTGVLANYRVEIHEGEPGVRYLP